MRVTSWFPLGLGAVAFGCGLFLLIDAVARSQERTGRPSRLLRGGAVPAGVPVVLAAVAAIVVIVVASVSTVVGAVATGVLVVATLVTLGRRCRRVRRWRRR